MLRFGTAIAHKTETGDFFMRVNLILTGKLALVSAAFCSVMLAFSPNANATPHPLPPVINLTIGDAHELGFVDRSVPTSVTSATLFVNYMIGLALGGSGHVSINGHDNLVTRSNHAFGPLPTAVFALTGHGKTIDLGTGLYSYLFAKYDGPNFGAEVWYVGNLSGIITIPATGGGYGLTVWKLFGPGAVPDGGATVMLLGAALGALGMARRFLKI
jgi:hypothetical protein